MTVLFIMMGFAFLEHAANTSRECPRTTVPLCRGVEIPLNDARWARTMLPTMSTALFYYEGGDFEHVQRRRRLLSTLARAWVRTYYDNFRSELTTLRRSCRPKYGRVNWPTYSYAFAHATRLLNASVFVIATNLTQEAIQAYNRYTPLSDVPGQFIRIVGIFRTVELCALRGLPIHVISEEATLEYCLAHNSSSCQRLIEEQHPSNFRVEELCTGTDVEKSIQSELHPMHNWTCGAS